MSGRRLLIGALSAFILSGVAAVNASAEGRAYTCSSTAGSKTFSDAHCITGGGSSFGHVLIEGSTTTTISNAQTAEATKAAAVLKLKGALAGVETEIQCTTATGSGELTNGATSVSGTGIINLTGCTVTKPAGKGCVVNGGKLTTELIALTTSGQAANNVKFTPAAEGNFLSLKIESCSIAALNNTFPVTGSFVATGSGATLSTTHAGITAQNTLKFGGVKSGLEGALTLSMSGGGQAITST